MGQAQEAAAAVEVKQRRAERVAREHAAMLPDAGFGRCDGSPPGPLYVAYCICGGCAVALAVASANVASAMRAALYCWVSALIATLQSGLLTSHLTVASSAATLHSPPLRVAFGACASEASITACQATRAPGMLWCGHCDLPPC